MKEKVYRLEGMLDKKSEINRQFLMHMKNNLDIRFFQAFDSNKIKSKRQKTIVLTVPQYSEVCISEHCWSRTEKNKLEEKIPALEKGFYWSTWQHI